MMPVIHGSDCAVSSISAGGMGKGWRVHDAKLDREVAIEVFPAALAQDPEWLVRFGEAKLAALKYLNIAMIHGLEDCVRVMELVEGPTVASWLTRFLCRD